MYFLVQPSSAIMSSMPTADASSSSAQQRTRLADAVRQRRLELGLSVRAAAENAEVARGTWISLEDGSRRTADNNYAGIERVLRWAPGSISTILEGGDATEVPGPAPRSGAVRMTAQSDLSGRANDDALIRVMGDDRISDRDKMRIAKILIDERERFERERVSRAEELIRAFHDDEP